MDRPPAGQAASAVRRIALVRPGEEDIVLLTDLLDPKKYPAADLFSLYAEHGH